MFTSSHVWRTAWILTQYTDVWRYPDLLCILITMKPSWIPSQQSTFTNTTLKLIKLHELNKIKLKKRKKNWANNTLNKKVSTNYYRLPVFQSKLILFQNVQEIFSGGIQSLQTMSEHLQKIDQESRQKGTPFIVRYRSWNDLVCNEAASCPD